MPLVRDKRSGKVAFLAHCILNHNSKVNGLATRPSGYIRLVKHILEKGYGIVQLPCPETAFLGLRRWWHVREQYDSRSYRDFCKEILRPSILLMREFYRAGYKILVVGVDGSPSCGVSLTGSSDYWGGQPTLPQDAEYPIRKGRGVFMETLLEEARKAGIENLRLVGLRIDLPGYDEDKAIEELDKYLD